MRDIEEIKRDLSYDASWWQPADLHSIACDLLAEVERLRSLLAPIIVPCERCGRKVRGNIERVCPVCADENWSLNSD